MNINWKEFITDFKVLEEINIKANNKRDRFTINFKKFYKNIINKYEIFFKDFFLLILSKLFDENKINKELINIFYFHKLNTIII